MPSSNRKEVIIINNNIVSQRCKDFFAKKINKNNELLENVVSEFFESKIKSDRPVRQDTIKSYKYNLISFIEFIGKEEVRNLNDLDENFIYKYIRFLKDIKKLSDETINIRLRTLKVFLNFLYKNKYITKNIKVSLINCVEKIPETFTDEQKRQIVKLVLNTNHDKKKYSINLLVLFLLSSGLRIHDAVNIKVRDLKKKNGQFVRVDLNDHEDVKYFVIHQNLSFMLIKHINHLNLKDEDYLLFSHYSQETRKRIAEKELKVFLNNAGFDTEKGNISARTFRLTFIKENLSMEGVDIVALTTVLGLKSVKSIEKYQNWFTPVNSHNADILYL